jgi:gamma-glutamyltranspeptidase/glutathione hydrolase
VAGSPFAVATPHRPATDAAVAAFERGGNALDAALAAASVLTVTYPHNCALGGDLFALVRSPGGDTVSVNASGPAGSRADRPALRAAGRAMPVTGPKTVTVPGLVAGWERIHALGARRSWASAIEPAIAYAEDGVAIARGLAEAIAEYATTTRDPGMAAVFAPGGHPLAAGERLRQPALARTLRSIAGEGARVFYDGDVARRIVDAVAAAGGDLTMADLRGFAPETGPPLRGRFGGLDILTSPANSSGVLVLQALAALEAADLADPLGEDAGTLAEILRLGDHDRSRLLGDPRSTAFDPEEWLGEARIDALLAEARRAADGHRPKASVRANATPRGDTVAIVASDGDGWAISLIQSLFHSFGAQILEPSTGVLLHNRGASFSLADGHPNALEPGRRPAHTLMPITVEENRRLAGVLGTMGGKVHAQIHVQVLLGLLEGRTPQQAVDAPRWIVGGMEIGERDDMIRIEEGCDASTRDALSRATLKALTVPRGSEWLGHAQAIWLNGAYDAGSDFRADGAAAASRVT